MTRADIEAFFARQGDLRLVLLFGSFGTARAGPDSDLDVAVLGDRPLTTERRLALISALGELTGRAVDLIDLRTAGLPVLRSALTTGRVVLDREPSERGRLFARFLIDAADFLPYYERILRERRSAWIG